MPSTLFTDIGGHIETASTSFYNAAAGNLSGAIGVIAIASVTMFISIYGAMVIAGKIQQPFQDFVVKAAKIMIVAAVALNAGNYLNWVVGAVNGLENGLVSAMNTTGGSSSDIYTSLDSAIDKANELMEQMNKEGSDLGITQIGRAISIALCICVVGFGTIIFLFVAGMVTILSKFALAMLFAVGPIFVLGLMWPATAGFFDRWIGQVLTMVFTIVFIAVLLNMGMDVFTNAIENAKVSYANPDGGNWFAVTFSLFGICVIFGFLAYQIPAMASAVGGGAGMAMMTIRQAVAPASAVGNLAGASVPFAGAAGRQSTRLDPRTGHQTSSSGAEHLAMGRSVWAPNPAYRNALRDRFKDSLRRPNKVSKG